MLLLGNSQANSTTRTIRAVTALPLPFPIKTINDVIGRDRSQRMTSPANAAREKSTVDSTLRLQMEGGGVYYVKTAVVLRCCFVLFGHDCDWCGMVAWVAIVCCRIRVSLCFLFWVALCLPISVELTAAAIPRLPVHVHVCYCYKRSMSRDTALQFAHKQIYKVSW